MIDLKRYNELKILKTVSFVKVGGNVAVSYKKWDEKTGLSLDSELMNISLKECQEVRDKLVKEIANIDAFMADVNAI